MATKSKSTKKRNDFLGEPIGDKKIEEVPGVGEKTKNLFHAKGYTKVRCAEVTRGGKKNHDLSHMFQ